jgi:Domain of unknown function (DUF6268)
MWLVPVAATAQPAVTELPATEVSPASPETPPPESRPWGPFPTSLAGKGGYDDLRGLNSLGGLSQPGLFASRVSYGATWYPSQPVAGQAASLGFLRQDLSMSAPAWRNETDAVMWSAHVRASIFNTDAVLSDSGREFPDTLWNVGVGASYMHRFDNGWSAGGMINVGSASDRPFDSFRDMNIGVGGFLRIPTSERSGWMLGAMYSATGEVPFPIPIVSYSWQPNDEFGMNIGLPFSVRWRPIEELLFDLSYTPIRNVHARASYRLLDGLGIYGGFDWTNEAYLLADRVDDRERFFYYEKTLSTGLRYDLDPTSAIDLSGGYAFDRFYFTGRQWSDQQHDRIDVGNGLFLSLRLQVRY